MTSSSSSSALKISKAVAAYTLLPDFWSRLVGFVPRFGLLAYLMAVIFETMRLIPAGHPILLSKEISGMRIRDVLAVAANNLNGGFKNCDQYIIFGMFVLGLILLGAQFIFLLGMLTTQAANAIPFVGFFQTVNPEQDIAFLMMDKIFGVPGFFGSCFDSVVNAAFSASVCSGYFAPATFPDPIQTGMQALFKFYSMGMLAVAGLVVLYFIVAMIIETVNTGVPFGNRFQSVFTPIRLVIAVMMLLPLANGYNSGQYVVLMAAKMGSSFATNTWLLFNNAVGDNPMGLPPEQLVGIPKIGDVDSIVNFLYLASTCKAAYEIGSPQAADRQKGVVIEPFMVKAGGVSVASSSQVITNATTYADALTFSQKGDIQIVFGEKNNAYTDYPGLVKPYCGVLTMPALSKGINGIKDIYDVYFSNVRSIWFDADMQKYGTIMACNLTFSGKPACTTPPTTSFSWGTDPKSVASSSFYIEMRQNLQSNFSAQMTAQINTMRTTSNPEVLMDAKILDAGWGGGGLWFNKVMAFNGAMVDALGALPTPIQMPMIMEHIAKKKTQSIQNLPKKDLFSLTVPDSTKGLTMDKLMDDGKMGGSKEFNTEVGSLFNQTYQNIQGNESTGKPKTGNTDSPVKNFVNLLFGQTGLFDFRANSEVFPLAKLAMLGRELINKTVVMVATTTLMSGMGGVIGADLGAMGEIMKSVGPSLRTFATIGLSIGILLYYIVPLMPFIYFFFAVGRWVKSIFEAMVAVPLWALAHLRLGGEGIPGPAAGQGYFLLLEIFLRPIFTLFGLMASIATFMALTVGLDSVFNLAVLNVGGYDMTNLSGGLPDIFAGAARDGIDALFYTVVYAILVYMIATSSFKLIDLLPNTLMRWGGSNTASFKDETNPIKETNFFMVTKVDQMARQITRSGEEAEKSFADTSSDRDRQKPTR